jgi:hypothetical protein
MEDFGGHSIAFALVKLSASGAGDDACSILSAVLEQVERIVDLYGG